MKTILKYIILAAIVAISLSPGGLFRSCVIANAGEVSANGPSLHADLMDANETRFIELINAARKDPLGVAESFGMKRKDIIKALPGLKELLIQGLPELEISERLYQSADDHTEDMLTNSYYAYESSDGQSVDQRMADAGYIASDFGESLGLLVFKNFLKSENAVLQIFESMFRKELDPSFEGQRNILNPNVKEVGVGFQGGVFRFDRYAVNAYIVTCDFGAEVELRDLQLLQLINQARVNPLPVAKFYGKRLDGFIVAFPEYYESMRRGLPPLEFNRQLYKASAAHAADMAENDYVGHNSLDKRSPMMRLKENGYFPAWMAESIYRMPIINDEKVITDEVTDIFKFIFNRAFVTKGSYDRNMFSAEAVDVGVSAVSQNSATGSISTNIFQLAVIEYAAKEEVPVSPRIIGTVYEDLNANGLYDVGEGISGALVVIKDKTAGDDLPEFSKQSVTNPAGGFSVAASPGQYTVQVRMENEEIQHLYSVKVKTVNLWVGLEIETETVE